MPAPQVVQNVGPMNSNIGYVRDGTGIRPLGLILKHTGAKDISRAYTVALSVPFSALDTRDNGSLRVHGAKAYVNETLWSVSHTDTPRCAGCPCIDSGDSGSSTQSTSVPAGYVGSYKLLQLRPASCLASTNLKSWIDIALDSRGAYGVIIFCARRDICLTWWWLQTELESGPGRPSASG
ncbi:hypothetical protein B0H17DRAFT_1130620 [Mycena rosella]|uniref:Uncharacterized protein n=1 Tax=Mycena rosella TaxID=1033263 RepID=A0AAD7DQU1_MYCRO|nr:hypothetical protein B0H17DRAFT_1130620 [Mycena rosella]